MINETDSEHDDEQLVAELMRTAANPEAMPEAMKTRLAASFAQSLEQHAAEKSERTAWFKPIALAPLAMAASMIFAFLIWPAPPANVAPESHSVVRSVLGLNKVQQANGERALHTGGSLFVGDRLQTSSNGLAAIERGSHRIRINANTKLELTPDGVRLAEGQIYVDDLPSAATMDDGIVVDTEFGRISDIGTQFMVTISADKNTASVREGTIKIQTEFQTLTAEASTIHARQIELGKETLSSRNTRRYGREWNWIQSLPALFSLNGRSVDEYLAWVSKETGLGITYDSAEVQTEAGQILLSGELSASTRPEDSLAQVLATTRLEHDVSDNGNITISARK